MPGVAGRSGGANAKRPETKLGRPNAAANATPGFTRIDASGEPEAVIPEPKKTWSAAARLVWDSLLASPTHIFAESSDYAFLYVTCEAVDAMSRGERKYSAGQLASVHGMMRELGMTEIQRRQAKILIDRTPPPVALAPISQIDAARRAFEE